MMKFLVKMNLFFLKTAAGRRMNEPPTKNKRSIEEVTQQLDYDSNISFSLEAHLSLFLLIGA